MVQPQPDSAQSLAADDGGEGVAQFVGGRGEEAEVLPRGTGDGEGGCHGEDHSQFGQRDVGDGSTAEGINDPLPQLLGNQGHSPPGRE